MSSSVFASSSSSRLTRRCVRRRCMPGLREMGELLRSGKVAGGEMGLDDTRAALLASAALTGIRGPGVEAGTNGLSAADIQALGLDLKDPCGTIDPKTLSARYALSGGLSTQDVLEEKYATGALSLRANAGRSTKMTFGGRNDRRRPPDLPSFILDNRIVWLGMPCVPSVTELVIAQLLYLANKNSKPVYVYVNSGGSQNEKRQSISYDTDAFGVVDTMNYINAHGKDRPGKVEKIATVVLCKAEGSAALIAGSGTKGYRFAMPNSRLKTAAPRLNGTGGITTNVMIQANNLEEVTESYVDILSRCTGRSKEECEEDIGRDKYYSPEAAIEYGLIDKIMQPEKPRGGLGGDTRRYDSFKGAGGGGGTVPATAGGASM